MFISNEGRWAAQLRKAKDNFLNYVNARVLGTGVRFSFSIKELDLMRMKDVAYREGIVEGKRALNAQYLENGEADA